MRRFWIFLILTLIVLPVRSQELHFGAAYWCPYSCSDKEMPGFLSEYFVWLMAKRGVTVKVEVMPFSRAVNSAEAGIIDGVLSMVPSEAPKLLATTSPTMKQRNCFFSNPNSKWKFEGADKMGNMRLGVIKDYAYDPEIDPYITKHEQPLVLKLRDSIPEQRLFSMLDSDRIDIYLSDFYVQRWQHKKLRAGQPKHRLASCFEDSPFYIGFSRSVPNHEELAAWVNQEVLKPENIKRRLEFEQRYQ